MGIDIPKFTAYLTEKKNASDSTVASYRRDLKKLESFLEEHGIENIRQITVTNLNSYILYLERQGLSVATVSRNIASIRSFFHYAVKKREIEEDPSENFKSAPRCKESARCIDNGRSDETFRTALPGKSKRDQR